MKTANQVMSNLAELRKAWLSESDPAVRARRAEEYIGAMEAQLPPGPVIRKAELQNELLPSPSEAKRRLKSAMEGLCVKIQDACIEWTDVAEDVLGLDLHDMAMGGDQREADFVKAIQDWVVAKFVAEVKESTELI